MAYTNKTPHYDLPQWIATDKPSYLSDQNQAYLDIDTAIFDAKTTAESSGSVANSALGAASAAQTAAESANTAAVAANANATEAKTSATQAITSATEANTAATNAAAAAQTAQTTAEGAKSTAESAQSAASAAAGSASTAQSRANEAYTLAQGASTTAGNANAAAQKALGQSVGSSKNGVETFASYDPTNKMIHISFVDQLFRSGATTTAIQLFLWQSNGNPLNLPAATGEEISNLPIIPSASYEFAVQLLCTNSYNTNPIPASSLYMYANNNPTLRWGYHAPSNHSVIIAELPNTNQAQFNFNILTLSFIGKL